MSFTRGLQKLLPQPLITEISLKFTHLKFDSSLPGANELSGIPLYRLQKSHQKHATDSFSYPSLYKLWLFNHSCETTFHLRPLWQVPLYRQSISCLMMLTHWGWVTHICVSKLNIIGSDNALSPGRRQAIIWTNAGILLTGPLRTNLSEILIGIQTFSLRKMHFKMSSGKWHPFGLSLNAGGQGSSKYIELTGLVCHWKESMSISPWQPLLGLL